MCVISSDGIGEDKKQKKGRKKCKLLHDYVKWLELGLESHFFITTTPNHQYLEMFGHVWFRKVGSL